MHVPPALPRVVSFQTPTDPLPRHCRLQELRLSKVRLLCVGGSAATVAGIKAGLGLRLLVQSEAAKSCCSPS